MSAPRLEIRLDHLAHNTRTLADRLGAVGIEVCAVTKATLGSPEVARVLLGAGARSLGESRIENVERLRAGGIVAPILLVRSPMLSQVDRVVASADLSCNSEPEVVAALSQAAVRRGCRHGVVLMVELGDLREGIMAADLAGAARRVLELPGVELRGIGTNLACQSGVVPDATNMATLSALATAIERTFAITLDIVSGGNSANLDWALAAGVEVGRVNHLRLGESILLGREPTRRRAVEGMRTDAVVLVGEIIESITKPVDPTGTVAETAFGPIASATTGRGATGTRVLVALGRQDVDPDGLTAPDATFVLGASSDHLVLAVDGPPPPVGTEVRFGMTYAALLRAMTSPFVAREHLAGDAVTGCGTPSRPGA